MKTRTNQLPLSRRTGTAGTATTSARYADGGNKAEMLLADALGLGPGDSPFPWQERLLRRFLEGDLPRALDIPTGLGKTATIAIWLVARALGAPLPRRLVYVVDRRAVVDQATEEVVRLREWVRETPRIQKGLGLGDRSLPVSTLRGQFVDNREWLEDPTAPGIIVGTVDMVGSRMLFSGYGVSRKMRPYHAGLLGTDSLIVLDEAHLVPPFERLMEQIAADGNTPGPMPEVNLAEPPPPRLLSLSATGRSRGGESFDLDDEDLRHEVVQRRLTAAKRLSVENLDGDLPAAVANRAWALSDQGALPIRCIVYTTRRDDAEKASKELSKLAKLGKKMKKGQVPPARVELLVGGRRVFERVEAAEKLRALGFLAGSEQARDCPAFLFATSAGEVGVDLDADHMVCDLVAWERMVQRLGRVNRRGTGDARIDVLIDPLPDKADDETRARREALGALLDLLPLLEEPTRDASPGAMRELQRTALDDQDLARLIERASTPDPLYPALDRPTLDAWSMTSLPHHPGRPQIAPWLRGWIEDRPQTTVIWRRCLPIPAGGVWSGASIRAFFEAAPPHASEKLETESFRVADWLGKRARRLLKSAEKAGSADSTDAPRSDEVVAIALQLGDGEPWTWSVMQLVSTPKKKLERALATTTLVLDARVAGLGRGLLDPSEDGPPPTLDGPEWIQPSPDGSRPPISFRVREVPESSAIEDRDWRERARFPLARGADGEVTRWLVVEKWRHAAATEDDRSAGREQLLDEHQGWTVERARRIATAAGLSSVAKDLLATAARLHDEGKRARRWQDAFHAPPDGDYAKTRGPLNVHLLDGYRHEFGSLLIAERDPALAALPADQRDLVLHLVASHHGFARPVIGTHGCEGVPPSALEDSAREVALRFARLQRIWGPWGLAWWEALLRSADQQASRDNDAEDTMPDQEEP